MKNNNPNYWKMVRKDRVKTSLLIVDIYRELIVEKIAYKNKKIKN